MSALNNEEEIDVMDSGNESEDETMSTDILEDIPDGSKSHLGLNGREACSKYMIVLNQDRRNGKESYYL